MFKKVIDLVQLIMKKKPARSADAETEAAKPIDGADKQYSKFGIGVRLISAFSIVSALTILISGVGWFSISGLTDAQQATVEKEVPAITLALKLANDTTQIAAAAPQLGTAKTNKGRERSAGKLTKAIETATNRLANLSEFVKDDGALESIDNNLKELAPLLTELDNLVKKRQELTTLRIEKMKRLEVLRKVLKTEVNPLMIPLRINMFDGADKLEEQIEAIIEDAKNGKEVSFDIDEQTQLTLGLLRSQESILGFQSSGYLMLSLLSEGALADTPAAVRKLSEAFGSSLSSMATPLSNIESESSGKSVDALKALFDELLLIGIKGTEADLIFEIRTAELKAIKASSSILRQSRTLAEELSYDANTFVTSVEESMKIATDQNKQLANNTKITLAVAALIAVLIAAAIGWLYIARSIIRRLTMMVKSAQRLSEGDIETGIYREGNDEIAKLGFALVDFRNTAREARKTEAEANRQRQKREEEKEQAEQERLDNQRIAREEKERIAIEAEETKRTEMDNLASEFEGSVKHLVTTFASATEEMTTISRSMAASAEETTALTKNVASASEMSSHSINSVAAATEELSSSINEISRQVGQAATIAGEAVTEADRSNNMVKSLDEAASKIGAVVGLINDIAGQTNLLALNATIEAARAGDAGKGFAVVASEVKNLATQTAKATEDISEQIKTVQEQTSNAVEAIGGIGTTIGRINEIATTISAAVEEQGAATSEISRSVQQAAEGAQNVTSNISSVNATANTTGQSAGTVQEVASKLASDVSGLDNEVERFLQQVRSS